MNLKTIYASLRADLSLIEKEMELSLCTEEPILFQTSKQLLKAGGKRLRPVFVLLSGKFGDYHIDKIKEVAVALELIHTASLVHDDVIDDADLRRGEPTVKAKWNNQTAMYTGDYILAKALERITLIESQEAHITLSETIKEVTIGEIEQIRDQFNWDQNLRSYLRRIKRKTALLISVSCRLGALVSDVPKHQQKHLERFGYFAGMSFQITDDILDFVGTKAKLGKPSGGDLKQGNVTLPALLAMSDPYIKEKITATLKNKNTNEKELNEALHLIKSSGAIECSENMSNAYLHKAQLELSNLPACKARQSLEKIAEYIGKRKF
ncbi:heptaprenyl diphosphate synthase component II [Pueribacillus theae]|uniref:Heptaprenyl diphosphate synthase component 2 n=1 Tax=Pueribacillus theae TaxID=2171751 RepID=A0A2U1K593_9BACI|nr:heptaprenyl diphosphate synthase component II [Pueribacillus theae]PWA12374.1 heptaprenyl diphosphate synthase component II [Pueribacillus theae]